MTKNLLISSHQIIATIQLLEEDATIPFIARYRKERTGGLDEVQISAIEQAWKKFLELDKRRASIIESIDKQGKLTAELRLQLENALDLISLEDLYLPYKPKKTTRAKIAREKGLAPLADLINLQKNIDLESEAKKYVNDKVKNIDEALQGARDILAEQVSENQTARNEIRAIFKQEAIITAKVVNDKQEEGQKYQDYFTYQELLKKCPSHRLLAIRRGEAEGILRVSISPNEETAINNLTAIFVKSKHDSSKQIALATKDAYSRLIKPSIETEYANSSKEKADTEAIKVFANNLRQLLLAAPLGQKRVLAIDPGFRTGCKVVCLDREGNLLINTTIYPHPPQNETDTAQNHITKLIKKYEIEAIAIGNGTAGRETEQFIKSFVNSKQVLIFLVNEDGASIYSASVVARQEFPNQDITVRGAVSIGRRLMDPLAELIKIEAKSLGIGQYQHAVDQKKLQSSLNIEVSSCVNLVGVNVNTASQQLLTYVSGLGETLATNVIKYRQSFGAIKSRQELKKVPRLGPKAFEQCAGFLRIPNSKNILDNTGVHPESYDLVAKMATDLGCKVDDLVKNKELRAQINLKKYLSAEVGLPTLEDIMKELAKPGLDPRETIEEFAFDQQVTSIESIKENMILPGIVTNVTNFGAFVDIGAKTHGLVHISELADKYVSNPAEVVSLNQKVKVRVLAVDPKLGRINLSMKIPLNGV